MASWSGGSSCPSESRTRGTGLYFTTYALEQLAMRLDNMNTHANWRTLAGDLRLNDLVVQSYEGRNGVNGFSATIALLRDHENAEGGIDFHKFQEILRNLRPRGRLDIITDIWNEENEHLLLERRVDAKCFPDSASANNSSGYEAKGFASSRMPPTGHQNNLSSHRPKSDPPTRRSPSYDKQNRHSDSSMEDLPQNLTGSISDDQVVRQEHNDFRSVPVSRKTYQNSPCPTCHCQNSLQQTMPTGLHSWEGNSRAYNGASPCVSKSYLVVSSEQEKDKKLCEKLKRLLEQKHHKVRSIHELTGDDSKLKKTFKKVNYTVVIYTENYLREIQMDNKVNAFVYKLMKEEYTKNLGKNKRFIPIYDTSRIRELPTELYAANLDEINYIVGLVNSSGKSPVPRIVREPHSKNHSLTPRCTMH